LLKPEEPVVNPTETQATENGLTEKKQFVEPEITVPVDVLEATTFFQAASSGATN
jgi:hypothetical protein